MNFINNIFNTNKRNINKYKKRVSEINKLIEQNKGFSDEEILSIFNTSDSEEKRLALSCIMSKRKLGLEPFDVQKIGTLALLDGKISEMKTGEGKSLVAALAATCCLEKSVFIVTTNDYLAKRDAIEMKPLFDSLQVSFSSLQEGEPQENKKDIYNNKIVYGTNSAFAFDFLYSHMVYSIEDKIQPEQNFAIVDECDSVLIDEAKTPLIISGENSIEENFYQKTFDICKKLITEEDFEINLKQKSALFTEEGYEKLESFYDKKKGELFTQENSHILNQCNQNIIALHIYNKEVDYIVENNEVKIIDEFSGRIQEGRRFGNGLHQSLEVKEGIEPNAESSTIAETSYQSYFGLFNRLSGMSGTAQSEATEFFEIYGLDTITIPTNKPVIRNDIEDKIFPDEKSKLKYLINFVLEEQEKNKTPFLIGTISVEQSILIEKAFKDLGIDRVEVLNAKNHFKESEIIANAGQPNSITISTNMAGRGVDIKINPDVKKHGLFVIGFERYQNRRIDNQLIGRSGRQGDPGSSIYLLSLEDNILRISDDDKESKVMNYLKKTLQGEEEGISFAMFSNTVHKRQKTLQEMFFQQRKEIWEFDKISESHRNYFYRTRDALLTLELEEFRIKNSEYVNMIIEDFHSNINLINGLSYSEEEYKKIIKETKDFLFSFISNKDDFTLLENELENISNGQDFFNHIYKFTFNSLNFFFKDKKTFNTLLETYNIKIIFLHELDEGWHTFLKEADHIKEGIHLRSYVQKDPKAEYTKESTILLENLFKIAKKNYIRVLLNLISSVDENENELKEEANLDTEKFIDNLHKILESNMKIDGFAKIFSSLQEWLPTIHSLEHTVFTSNIRSLDNISKNIQNQIIDFCEANKYDEAINLLAYNLKDILNNKLKESSEGKDIDNRLILNKIYSDSGHTVIQTLSKQIEKLDFNQIIKVFNFNTSALFISNINRINFKETSKEEQEIKEKLVKNVVSSIKAQLTYDNKLPSPFDSLTDKLSSNIFLNYHKNKNTEILKVLKSDLGIEKISSFEVLKKEIKKVFLNSFEDKIKNYDSKLTNQEIKELINKILITNYSIINLKYMEAQLDFYLEKQPTIDSKELVSLIIDMASENALKIFQDMSKEELSETISSLEVYQKDISSFINS